MFNNSLYKVLPRKPNTITLTYQVCECLGITLGTYQIIRLRIWFIGIAAFSMLRDVFYYISISIDESWPKDKGVNNHGACVHIKAYLHSHLWFPIPIPIPIPFLFYSVKRTMCIGQYNHLVNTPNQNVKRDPNPFQMDERHCSNWH